MLTYHHKRSAELEENHRNEACKLAFGPTSAQYASAIYVLACFSAIRPVLGRLIQITRYDKVVRHCARIVRGIFYMEAKEWLSEL